MSLTPKNWATFQHYKDRAPTWIKLHKSLLDDYTFSRLPVASRALAPCLWLLASEYEGGEITASMDEMAFRLRMPAKDLEQALKPLIDNGFFSASEPLAERYQTAIPEKKEEKEVEREKEGIHLREFRDEFWPAYPNKTAKPDALKKFISKRKIHPLETIMAGLERYIATKPPDRQWLNPSTFLNQERYLDQPAHAGPKTFDDIVREHLEDIDERVGGARGGRSRICGAGSEHNFEAVRFIEAPGSGGGAEGFDRGAYGFAEIDSPPDG